VQKASTQALRPLFDEYWSNHSEALVSIYKYKGKKSKGGSIDTSKAQGSLESTVGFEKLYQNVLADFALKTINEHLTPEKKSVMFVADVRLNSYTETDECFVIAVVFLWPEMTFDGEIDYHVERKIPRDFDAAFEQQCKNLTFKHRIAKEVAEGSEPEFIYLEIDDDQLYVAEGFENKEAFKQTFDLQWNAYMDNSDKHFAFEAIFDKIIQQSHFESIPQKWLEVNTDAFLIRHLQSVGNDKKKAMEVLGVKTDEQMRHKFAGEVYRQTIHQMSLNWYSDKFGVPADELSVSSDLIEKVIWV